MITGTQDNPLPFMISGNSDVGVCCSCDLYDGHGRLITHIAQISLFKCKKIGCNHYSCKEHLKRGYCLGCYLEQGLV